MGALFSEVLLEGHFTDVRCVEDGFSSRIEGAGSCAVRLCQAVVRCMGTQNFPLIVQRCNGIFPAGQRRSAHEPDEAPPCLSEKVQRKLLVLIRFFGGLRIGGFISIDTLRIFARALGILPFRLLFLFAERNTQI